jgi:hypothetical protein
MLIEVSRSAVSYISGFAPFVQFCFLGCFIAFVLAKPPRSELIGVMVAGIPLGIAFETAKLGTWISGFGLSAGLWAVLAPFFQRHPIHPSIALMPLYPTLASLSMLNIQPHGGYVMDRYLLAADGSFGFQPAVAAQRFLTHHGVLLEAFTLFYVGLPMAVAVLLHTPSGRTLVRVCLALAVAGFTGYAVFPAVGWIPAFPDGGAVDPGSVHAASFASTMFAAADHTRNTMPSLHTAWCSAVLAAAWPLGWRWRIGMLLYAIPMLFYTLANNHYFVDMIVGVALMYGVSCAVQRNWGGAGIALAAAAVWLLLIRYAPGFFYISPVVPWLLAAATVALPWLVPRVYPWFDEPKSTQVLIPSTQN